MRFGSPASAAVRSTAFFNDANLSFASRSLRASRRAIRGGVSERATGPNATTASNTIHSAVRFVAGEINIFRATSAARNDARNATTVAIAMTMGRYDAAMPSLGYQITKLRHRPPTVPSPEAKRKMGQRLGFKTVEKPVQRAAHNTESHHGSSKRGSIAIGNQHEADPSTTRSAKRASLDSRIRLNTATKERLMIDADFAQHPRIFKRGIFDPIVTTRGPAVTGRVHFDL